MAIMPKFLMIPTIVLLLCCFVLSSSSGSERPSLFEKNGVQRIIRDAVPEPGQRKSTTNKIFLELHGGGALEQGLSSPVKVSRQILKSDGEKDILPAPNDSSPLPSRNRVLLSMSYLAGMGVCGIVLAALGSSLNGLATNCGTSAVKVGTVFVARGAGAVAGTLSSARLYNALPGRLVAGTALAFFTVALLATPMITNTRTLHIAFAAFGVCTAVLDTGCQILTRKLHGREAGPWLGANTVAFGISGCAVPWIAYMSGSLQRQYEALAALAAAAGAALALAPRVRPEDVPPPAVRPSQAGEYKVKLFGFETVIACMVFCLVGGKVTSTAYFTNYVLETKAIKESQVHFLLMLLWGGITAGRFAGIQQQRKFDSVASLGKTFRFNLMAGAAAMALIGGAPRCAAALWAGVGLYGLFNGPTVGFAYDLNNRLTVATSLGTSVVMLGLNTGASLVPYATSALWHRFPGALGPRALLLVLAASHLAPLALLRALPAAAPRDDGGGGGGGGDDDAGGGAGEKKGGGGGGAGGGAGEKKGGGAAGAGGEGVRLPSSTAASSVTLPRQQ